MIKEMYVCIQQKKTHATNKEYFDTEAHFTYAFSFTYSNLIVNLVVTPLVDKFLQKLRQVMPVELSCRLQIFLAIILWEYRWEQTTVKPVSNDHLYDKIYYLWLIQWCVLMKIECTNLLLLTFSTFWGSSRWPLATWMSSRRQRSIPLGGRHIQVSLYILRRVFSCIGKFICLLPKSFR